VPRRILTADPPLFPFPLPLFPALPSARRSEVLSRWTSNEDIVDAMHASMHIPFYMSYRKPVAGGWGIDGGLSANVFDINGDPGTIKVTSTRYVLQC